MIPPGAHHNLGSVQRAPAASRLRAGPGEKSGRLAQFRPIAARRPRARCRLLSRKSASLPHGCGAVRSAAACRSNDPSRRRARVRDLVQTIGRYSVAIMAPSASITAAAGGPSRWGPWYGCSSFCNRTRPPRSRQPQGREGLHVVRVRPARLPQGAAPVRGRV